VQVNELSQGAITINNTDLTNTGLGLGAAATNAWATTTDINTDIAAIDAALSKLASTASGFANSLSLIQTRQDFTNNLINTLKDGSSSLTIADKNEEGANMLALQTQQQLGIEALSLSSQANQSVLRLFG
jgi:flagellin-like hook-associated protein FlgL